MAETVEEGAGTVEEGAVTKGQEAEGRLIIEGGAVVTKGREAEGGELGEVGVVVMRVQRLQQGGEVGEEQASCHMVHQPTARQPLQLSSRRSASTMTSVLMT